MNCDSIHVRLDLKGAHDALKEKLLGGDTVGRCNLFDALDCEMQDERYRQRFDEIAGILRADPQERAAMIDTLLEGVAERYLDSHEELVHKQAEQMLEEPA